MVNIFYCAKDDFTITILREGLQIIFAIFASALNFVIVSALFKVSWFSTIPSWNDANWHEAESIQTFSTVRFVTTNERQNLYFDVSVLLYLRFAPTVVWKQVSWNLLSTISDVFYCQNLHSHQIWLNLVQWPERAQQI